MITLWNDGYLTFFTEKYPDSQSIQVTYSRHAIREVTRTISFSVSTLHAVNNMLLLDVSIAGH